MSAAILSKQRVNSLVNRWLTSAGEVHAVVVELCDLIRRENGEEVLATIKDPFKHGTPEIQLRAIALLNQCVMNSGPEFTVLLSSDQWSERLFRVAKTTESPEVRDELFRVVTQWSSVYSTSGLRRCVSRFANSKTLGAPYERIARELEQASQRSRQATDAPTVDAVPISQGAAAPRPRQHQDPSVMNAVDAFLGAAQMDLCTLEYSLQSMEMDAEVRETAFKDCSAHKDKAARILEQYPGLPQEASAALCALLEQLNEFLTLYSAIHEVPEGDTNLDASLHRAASTGGAAISDAEEDSDDDEKAKEMKQASRRQVSSIESRQEFAAMQLEANAAKMLEEERKQSQEIRDELEKLRQEHEELSAKHKAAKAKNKKAVAVAEELAEKVDALEAEKEQQQQNSAAAAAAPPKIVEKVVEKRPVVAKGLLTGIQSKLSSSKSDVRQLRNEMMDLRKDFDLQLAQISSGVAHMTKAADADKAKEGKALQWIQDLYKKEMKLRKQYYNQIQELKGNIRVYCRVRPMSKTELANGHENVVNFPAEDEMRLVDDKGKVRNFEFDKVYKPESAQQQVFEDTLPLIDSVVDGFSVCIFAYGQTGSGKTFTMNGYDDRGINKRALDRLFECIKEREESEESSVHCSVLEIYCEKIRDLLVPRTESSKKSYDVKTGGQYGHYVTNLTELDVKSPDEIENIMNTANSNRSEGKTDMNLHSSRSHMLVYILIKTKNKHTGAMSYGKLSLVDLAGSERLDKSGAEGVAAKEAMSINTSLSALGGVISGLSNQAKHIPFRDSQLTFLLQDSMAGQAKVLMFCCVSPASYNVSESLSSLGFATRARGVSLGPVKKNTM